MIRRVALVVVTAATLLPLAAGPASASCLDDFLAQYEQGAPWTPSPYYGSLGYVGVTGTATVTVRGDALIQDANALAAWTAYVAATGIPRETVDFANCVAG